MLRTLMVGLFPRAASIALGFLFCFCLAATAGEMTSSLLIGNARIDMVIEPTSPYPPAKDIFRWVKSASESVTNYYGRFPVPRVLIRITPFEGRGVADGMTFGDRGGRITIRVGSDTSPAEFHDNEKLLPVGADMAGGDPEQFIEEGQSDPWMPTLKDCELLSQGEIF